MFLVKRKFPFSLCIIGRHYAANTDVKVNQTNPSVVHPQNHDVKLTETKQINVVSLDAGGPIAHISATFLAGACFERKDEIGISHYIRRCIGLKSKVGSNFLSIRTGQQQGISVSCSADRELITVTVRSTEDAICEALCCLKQSIMHPLYLPWEIKANEYYINEDLARQSGASLVYDLLHKAAFRHGLGNSLFCPRYYIGNFDGNRLHSYYMRYFHPTRCTIAGINIQHQILTEFAGSLSLGSTTVEPVCNQFYGGERRSHTHDRRWANVAIATEGTPFVSNDTIYAFAVLQHIWGYGPRINFNAAHPPPIGLISKAIEQAVPESLYRCSAINVSYSNTGLFGFLVSTEHCCIGAILNALMKLFKSGTVSDQDFEIGKKSLKNEILFAMESEGKILAEMGGQVMLLGKMQPLQDIIAAVDNVCKEDILKAAKHVADGKLAMAAIGNLETVPYLDEL